MVVDSNVDRKRREELDAVLSKREERVGRGKREGLEAAGMGEKPDNSTVA